MSISATLRLSCMETMSTRMAKAHVEFLVPGTEAVYWQVYLMQSCVIPTRVSRTTSLVDLPAGCSLGSNPTKQRRYHMVLHERLQERRNEAEQALRILYSQRHPSFSLIFRVELRPLYGIGSVRYRTHAF